MAASPAHGLGAVRLSVRVELKDGVADPEGEAVERSLALLGIGGVRSVRTAKVYELVFSGVSDDEARARADEAVERLLANPVIHRVTVRPHDG